jgi:hypothetical protein
MGRILLTIAIAFTVGCGKNPSTAGNALTESSGPPTTRSRITDDFFVNWFKGHGHSNVVVDDGVGVEGNATRLKASLYNSKKHANGGYVVELEFTIRLPSQQTITEFVAGMGDKEEDAIGDAKVNFILSTFHVVYKGFINAADPHLDLAHVEIDGTKREVIIGDIYRRGGPSDKKESFIAVRKEIRDSLRNVPLSTGSHWMKIVYSQKDGQPMTVSAQLDNQDHKEFTEVVKNLNWPRSKSFYTAKLFIVVK